MKVSIITSCYNREATIAQAIESVIRQDYPCIEYIVIDGASDDRSLEIINAYSDRIAKIISEPDSGMYEGINKGIQAATGDIIGLLHSDDFLFDTHHEDCGKVRKHRCRHRVRQRTVRRPLADRQDDKGLEKRMLPPVESKDRLASAASYGLHPARSNQQVRAVRRKLQDSVRLRFSRTVFMGETVARGIHRPLRGENADGRTLHRQGQTETDVA